jgi:MinD-like ATPase involved in chromosome partitioning or flagellar assembly
VAGQRALYADRIVSIPPFSPLRAERSTLSEQNWQATVLAELGVSRSGLVTPDSSGRPVPPAGSPAAETAPAPVPPVEFEPPAPAVPSHGPGERWSAPPVAATEWDPPQNGVPASAEPTAYDAPEPTAYDPPGPSSWAPPAQDGMAPPAAWPGGAAPPAAEVHAGPASPQLPTGDPAQYEQDAPDPSAGEWELASQSSWGLVAHQGPWNAEPPVEERGPQEPWERSQAEAPPYRPGPQGQPSPQDLVRRSTHGDPLVRRVSRGVRRAMGAAVAHEVRRTADVENALGRPVPSCRQIAVTSIRGGAGKTTVAGLVATVIAQYRQDRVLALDADSGLGSLPLRLNVRSERSLHDLGASRPPQTFEEAAPFLGRTADGLWVMSGTSGGQITHELDLATFKTAAGVMSRYFAALVIDCGAGLLPDLQRGILTDAHAQVMVTPGTVDGAISARGALEWQARNGYAHLLTRTIVALITHTPHVDADLTRGAQLLSSGGMPVVHMPYDRHLATGTAIESARIGQETRAAAIRLALEAFARAASV